MPVNNGEGVAHKGYFSTNGAAMQGLGPAYDGLARDVLAAVQERQGKRRPNGEWRFRCPFPERHNNGDRSPSADYDPDAKVWMCRAGSCNGGGGLLDLAEALGIDLDHYQEPGPVPPPAKRQNSHHTNGAKPDLGTFAKARDLDAAVLAERWQVRAATYSGRPALRYPTRCGVDRIKFLDDAAPGYQWATKGGAAHLYGATSAVRMLDEQVDAGAQDVTLYVVNGEPAVWAAHERGVPAVCTCAGESAWQQLVSLADDLRDAADGLDADVTVAVVWDADKTGRECSVKAASGLRLAGLDAVALDIAAAPWGDDGPPVGADVGDLAQLVGNDLADTLAGLPALLPEDALTGHYTPILEWQAPTLTWLFRQDGEPIIQGGDATTLLYGRDGQGKTTVAMALAASIASDGHQVVWVAGEDAGGVQRRAQAYARHHDTDLPSLLLRPDPPRLTDDEELGAFVDDLKLLKPDVVFLDPWVGLMPGIDENASAENTAVIDALNEVRALGVAFVVVHHSNAGGSRSRGHSSLEGWCAGRFKVEDDDGLTLTCEKQRNAAKAKVKAYRLRAVDLDERDSDGNPVSAPVALPTDADTPATDGARAAERGTPDDGLSGAQRTLLKTLAALEEPVSMTTWANAADKPVGGATYRHRSTLAERDLVACQKTNDGKRWHVTPSGYELLGWAVPASR